MMRGGHHLVIRLRALPGLGDALGEALLRLQQSATTTPGCSGFIATQDLAVEGQFWLIESFDSAAAYDEFVVTPAVQRFLNETVPELVVDREIQPVTLAPG